MFVPSKVAAALEGKREAFRQAVTESADLQERYREVLSRLDAQALEDGLGDAEWPGARPTSELANRGLIVPFARRWETAQEARVWALEQLQGVPTVAVDGSQIAASKEFSTPLSLVQVAWFENYHDPDRPYIKDVRNEIVTVDDRASEVEEYVQAESRLNQRRFALEMQIAVERIQSLGQECEAVVFLDGSLILSFIGRLWPESRQPYLKSIFSVLDASLAQRVPALGYVDLSFASDLVTMFRTGFDLPAGNVFDAQILMPTMEWFDRTAAFQCARRDILPMYRAGERDYSQDLCFVYLKTGGDRVPARIDFPRWILDAGLLDRVLDIVRAEVVVGSGYPYALETADAAAVLTTEDRLAFYRLFHDFAQVSGIVASLPGKSISKAHRR